MFGGGARELFGQANSRIRCCHHLASAARWLEVFFKPNATVSRDGLKESHVVVIVIIVMQDPPPAQGDPQPAPGGSAQEGGSVSLEGRVQPRGEDQPREGVCMAFHHVMVIT